MREDRFTNTERDAALYEARRGQADDVADRLTLAEAIRDEVGDWRFAAHDPGEVCMEWAGVDDAWDGPDKVWECVECGRTHRQGDEP